MRVRIVNRFWSDVSYRGIRVEEVEIKDTCPVCGGPRGKPRERSFFEDGDTYSVHSWDNPCGHVDLYKDVYREANGGSD